MQNHQSRQQPSRPVAGPLITVRTVSSKFFAILRFYFALPVLFVEDW